MKSPRVGKYPIKVRTFDECKAWESKVWIKQSAGPLGERFTLGPEPVDPLATIPYVHSAHANVFTFFGSLERFSFAIAVLSASFVVNILRRSQSFVDIAGLNLRFGLKPVESPPAS